MYPLIIGRWLFAVGCFSQDRVCRGDDQMRFSNVLWQGFATNLLDQGVDLHYIRQPLGYDSTKLTERYAHMTQKDFAAKKAVCAPF